MAVDVRDIFMVIRAKDQASRVMNQAALNSGAAFRKIQRDAQIAAQNTALQGRRITQTYGEQILRQQKILNGAMMQGNAVRAAAARQAIRDLRIQQREEQLALGREQIKQRQFLLTQRRAEEARRAAVEHHREVARSAGTWVTVGATMALVGGIGVAAMHKMAMGAVEYQKQAALTMTQVHNQATSIKELQTISNNVAKAIGVPFNQLQASLYDIFSSTDVSVKESEALLTSFAKAAVAGQTDIQRAGRATIAFMNAFKVPASDVNKLLDIQFEAVRLGSMTYEEFASNVGKAIPAVVNASQSIEFLAGTAAFLTRNGQTAAAAFVAIARGSEMFLRKPVQASLRAMGIEALNASGRLRPINELMTELAPHFAGLDDMARKRLFEKIFGGQNFAQARRFFDLAIKDSKSLNRFINDVSKSSGQFGKAYATMAATTAVQTELLKNNWQVFSTELGAQAMPSLNKLLKIGISILGWLNDLSPVQKRVLADLLTWGSVALAAAGSIVALAGAVKILTASLAILKLQGSGVIGLIQGLGGASLSARLGIVGLIVAATAFAAIKFNEEVRKAADESERTGRMMTLGGKGGQFFAERVSGLTAAVKEHTPAMNEARQAMYESTLAGRMATSGVIKLGDAHTGIAPKIQQVIELTEEERDKIMKLAETIVQSGLRNYATQQDQIAEATRRLSEAQANLARVQGGSVPTANSLSSAQERIHDASVRVEKAQISLADKTKDSQLEHIRLREAQHDLSRAQAAGRSSNLSTAASSDELRNAVDRVTEAERALKEASGLTAAEVDRQFRELATATKNMSDNMITLIRRGMDPKLVAHLAEQGPLHVAKFARLSKKEIDSLNRNFNNSKKQEARAQKIVADAMAGDIAKYEQRGTKSVEKLRAANATKVADMRAKTRAAMIKAGEDVSGFRITAMRELGKIKGVTRNAKFTSTFSWPKDLPKEFRSMHAIVGKAMGGLITTGSGPTADDNIIRVSKGETVVPARSSAKPAFRAWAASERIPGFQQGGLIGMNVTSPDMRKFASRIQAGFGDMATLIARGMSRNLRINLGTLGLGAFGMGGGTGGGTGGTIGFAANAWRVFQRVFGLPMGGYRPTGSVPGSDHPKRKAIDIMTSNRALHQAIIALGKKLPGSKYWISYRQIGSAPDWRSRYYGGPSPHTDHVHWSFFDNGGRLKPGWNRVFNGTGRDEVVTPAGQSGDLHIHVHAGNLIGGQAAADQLAELTHKALLKRKRERGGVLLGIA